MLAIEEFVMCLKDRGSGSAGFKSKMSKEDIKKLNCLTVRKWGMRSQSVSIVKQIKAEERNLLFNCYGP